ncbi:hypothetical protein GGI08_006820, partial [Coemansia sp. S2]
MRTVDFNNPLTIGYISQLSSLTIRCEQSPGVNLSLIHNCASTLIDLVIWISDVKALFYDTNSNAVVYPNLQELLLTLVLCNDPIERVSVPNIVPFPSLEGLKINMPYPFADEVLLRGNRATLRSLSLRLDRTTVAMLNSNRVFEEKHNNFKVSISKDIRANDIHLVSKVDMNQFIGNMVGSAQSLELYHMIPFNELIAAAPQVHGFKHLQNLYADWLELSVFDMLCLFKAAPALVKITCGIFNLGTELESIASGDLPDYIASTYGNTGKHFQVWNKSSYKGTGCKDTIEPVILLALACPKFCRIEMSSGFVSDYRTRMAEALLSDKYSKYASRVSK